VIEVAESSLPYDRTTKLRLYARAGVREYWVVSVAGEWIEVYRSPEGDGYRDRLRAGVGERIAPADFADVTIDVGEVFA
jgi:Uma2 family endonuclease